MIEGIKFNRIGSLSQSDFSFELIVNNVSKGTQQIQIGEDGYYYLNVSNYQEEAAKSTDSIVIMQSYSSTILQTPVYQKPATIAGEVVLTSSVLGGWTFPSNRFTQFNAIYNLNTNKYTINAPIMEQSPGTFSYSCVITNEETNQTVTSNSSVTGSDIIVEFSDTGQSTYIVEAEFTDHFHGSTIGARARIYDLSKSQRTVSAPINLVATQVHSTGLNLKWEESPSSLSVSEYRIYRSDQANNIPGANSSEFELIATVDGSTLQFFDGTVTRDHSYRYRIQAVDSSGEVSEYSKQAYIEMRSITKPDMWEDKFS